jgi:penicillin-binding protein 1A
MSLKIIGIFIVFCFLLIVGLFAYFRKDILSFNNISGSNLGGSIAFYDRTGKVLLWEDYNSVKRIPVPFNQISPYMKEATVAIEDKNFYHEGGVDFFAILRSAVHDIIHHGQGLEGASTITEQVVKLNKGWQDPLTIKEKIEEIGLAVVLARDYSKNQILNAYLNIVPYGNIDYGVQAAAQDYFNTSAANLTLAQSAMLAAIPQAPTEYSPFSSPVWNSALSADYFDAPALTARAHYILQLMVQQHMISQSQANAAMKVNVLAEVQPLQSKYSNIKYPYFDLAAKQQLIDTYGQKLINKGTWKVITTLSVPLQNLAQQVVAGNAYNALRVGGADEEALVAEQVQTGQVVAYVGNENNLSNPIDGQINYAAININPGSTIKPYVYSTFINNPKNNAGAGSVIYDVQEPLPGYPCTDKALPINDPAANCLWDYDYRYPGPETLRYALAGSRNVPAVKVGLMAGISNIQNMASKMMGYPDAYRCYQPNSDPFTDGPSQQVPCYGSAAIGTGYLYLDQTVNGLATLARMGQAIPQTYILNITDSNGNTIYQWKQPKPDQVLNQDTAYIMNNMLSDPRATYLPGYCTAYTCTQLSQGGYKWERYNGWDIAVKTGTDNSDQSGLMAGWTTQYAVISWAGWHTVSKQLKLGTMEEITEPMTRGWLQGALNMLNIKPVNWVQPSNIQVLPAYVQRVHVGLGSEEPGPTKELFPYWYKAPGTSSTEVIDKVSGLLATSCTPPDARETVGGANSNTFSVDKFWPINQSNKSSVNLPTAYDNVHQCSDVPPSIVLTTPASNGGICSNTDNNGQGCAIVATATQGTHPLGGGSFGGTITISINGQLVKTFNVSNSPATVVYYYSPTSTGTVTVSATVTDSVLYQTSSSVQINTNYTQPSNNNNPQQGTNTGSGGNSLPTGTTTN